MSASVTDSDRLDAVYDALVSDYRRYALLYLLTRDGDGATVADIVDFLQDYDDVTADEQHVSIRLQHVALPKLDAAGFVDYDHRSETVRYRESPVLERELSRSVDATDDA